MGVKLDSLNKLFIHELKDLYSAETQLVEALPKMAEAASSPKLQQAFKMHLEQTQGHVKRIEQIFQDLKHEPTGEKCKGMEGLIKEGESLIKQKKEMDPDVLDAGLIGAAQRVEHYEIAGYGTVTAFAKLMGKENFASLLHQTLEEEKNTDEKLTQLAESAINQEALA
jgi:ferritin-like metal-binding protein YciE